jgi:hypothetical protein
MGYYPECICPKLGTPKVGPISNPGHTNGERLDDFNKPPDFGIPYFQTKHRQTRLHIQLSRRYWETNVMFRLEFLSAKYQSALESCVLFLGMIYIYVCMYVWCIWYVYIKRYMCMSTGSCRATVPQERRRIFSDRGATTFIKDNQIRHVRNHQM